MDEIIQAIKDYVRQNDISLTDMDYFFTDLKLETYRELAEKDQVYVFKRQGNLQEFDYSKIERSIKNAGRDAGVDLSSSDLKIIQSLVEDKLREDGENIIKSSSIRLFVVDSLKKANYKEIATAYQNIHFKN